MDPEIKVVPDAAEVAREAAERVIAAANRASDEGRTFSIALSGGSTPKALFELLATEPYKSRVDWAKVDGLKDFGGVRIEDDVLITESGADVLTLDIPKTIAEIESLREEAFDS